MSKKNIRNFIGYGSNGKKIIWPNNAKLALQIVLNYEEGGENCVLNGDKFSETFLSGQRTKLSSIFDLLIIVLSSEIDISPMDEV